MPQTSMKSRWVVIVPALILPALIACASGQRPSESPKPIVASSASVALTEPARLPKGHVWRSEVMTVMSPGMGTFLQRVSVREHLVNGQFHGFRIEELRGEPTFWNGVDLRPGDIVTAVNGQPIGHYDQAYRAWQGLATASALVVSFERGGVPRELRYAIHDQGGSAPRP